jgi:transcription antitermination factor NusG
MPILQAEPQLYPECLFEQTRESSSDRKWWVLHTRPRQEKSLARQLYAGTMPFYLPLISRRLHIRQRVVNSYLPLFGGYVFLLAEPDERLMALGTKRVVRSIPVADQDGLWRDLTQMHRLICSGAPITPEDRLSPGTLVEIRSGPLAGLRGKILDKASRRRFVVEIDFIQRGASVLLDDFTLAPVMD